MLDIPWIQLSQILFLIIENKDVETYVMCVYFRRQSFWLQIFNVNHHPFMSLQVITISGLFQYIN